MNHERLGIEMDTQAAFEFVGSQVVAVKFSDIAFGVNPTRFDGIEPGTFCRQETGENAHIALLLGFPIVSTDPLLSGAAGVPAGLIPNHRQDPFALGAADFQQPLPHELGLRTIGLSIGEIQVGLARTILKSPKAGQGFGFRVVFGVVALDQLHRLLGFRPGAHGWLRKATEPTLILVNQPPI